MNDRIRDLLAQIASLEDELRNSLHEQEQRVAYTLHGKRIEFEKSVQQAHQRLRRSLFYWVLKDRPLNLLTGPVIYSMIVPLVLLDVCISLYQLVCFPVYGVARVKRAEYFVFDRHHLGYLNFIEKFHCDYCSYATGLMAYATEIVARTEQYFCPIKHARKVLGSHVRTHHFLAYGHAQDYHERLEQYRRAMKEDAESRS